MAKSTTYESFISSSGSLVGLSSYGSLVGQPGGKGRPTPPPTTYGADPEFMLFDTKQNKIVSAIGVLKNDKYSPVDLKGGIMMYADNVLVEFSFPPAKSIMTFLQNMRVVLSRGQKALGPRYRLIAMASHVYDDEELADPKAREGGCSPNFNVHTQRANLPPDFQGGLRTGSFHIHVGDEALKDKEQKDNMIRWMDMNLGVASILFDKDTSSPKRRDLYGRAGEFRPTPYGVEYRVLGPYSLRSPRLTALSLCLTHVALENAKTKPAHSRLTKQAETIINSNNRVGARDFIGDISVWMRNEITRPMAPDLYRDWGIGPEGECLEVSFTDCSDLINAFLCEP